MSPQVNFTPSNGNWFQKQQSPFEKKVFHFRIDAFTLFKHVEPVIEKHVKSLNSIWKKSIGANRQAWRTEIIWTSYVWGKLPSSSYMTSDQMSQISLQYPVVMDLKEPHKQQILRHSVDQTWWSQSCSFRMKHSQQPKLFNVFLNTSLNGILFKLVSSLFEYDFFSAVRHKVKATRQTKWNCVSVTFLTVLIWSRKVILLRSDNLFFQDLKSATIWQRLQDLISSCELNFRQYSLHRILLNGSKKNLN